MWFAQALQRRVSNGLDQIADRLTVNDLLVRIETV
jgi:hypothetical protein